MKEFFRKILKLGTEKAKDIVVNEITSYYDDSLYSNKDLHDIANNTSKENETNDYIYGQSYDYQEKILTCKKTSIARHQDYNSIIVIHYTIGRANNDVCKGTSPF